MLASAEKAPRTGTAPGQAPPRSDRRGSPRIHTVYFVVKVTREADAGLFRVRNISDTGLMLCSHVMFEVGERLALDLAPDCTVHGTVSRCEGECCAVSFATPIDSAALLRARARQKEDRRSCGFRLPVSTLATVYSERGIRAVTITDLSRRGLGLVHDGSLEPDMAVQLHLENGTTRSGTIHWSRDGRAGVRLAEPLSCADLESARTLGGARSAG